MRNQPSRTFATPGLCHLDFGSSASHRDDPHGDDQAENNPPGNQISSAWLFSEMRCPKEEFLAEIPVCPITELGHCVLNEVTS